jgi:hypothetical protein
MKGSDAETLSRLVTQKEIDAYLQASGQDKWHTSVDIVKNPLSKKPV